MAPDETISEQDQFLLRDNYTIDSLADEIRADQLCSALLKQFHRDLLENSRLEPLEAGSLASGADYFLRDFMISHLRSNIFSCRANAIRRFAGHWYIISNLEPNLAELSSLLKGTESFYQFCAAQKLIEDPQVAEIAAACQDLPYYQQRIESFHAITGDGFNAWEKNAR